MCIDQRNKLICFCLSAWSLHMCLSLSLCTIVAKLYVFVSSVLSSSLYSHRSRHVIKKNVFFFSVFCVHGQPSGQKCYIRALWVHTLKITELREILRGKQAQWAKSWYSGKIRSYSIEFVYVFGWDSDVPEDEWSNSGKSTNLKHFSICIIYQIMKKRH